jgi:hypothetical protein
MGHLKNFLERLKQVLVLGTGSQYIRPSRNGFYRDLSLLQGDARRVASDLSKVTKKYGEQAYNRKSK